MVIRRNLRFASALVNNHFLQSNCLLLNGFYLVYELYLYRCFFDY